MLAMFEKLINEHGSSTILKERIQLISDKYSILEDKKNLEDRNKHLEEALALANEKIEQLESQVSSQSTSNDSISIDEVEKKILKHLFDSNQGSNPEELASMLAVPVGNIEYHLDKLLELDFLHDHLNMMSGTSYSIKAKVVRILSRNLGATKLLRPTFRRFAPTLRPQIWALRHHEYSIRN